MPHAQQCNVLRFYGTWFSSGNWISDFLLAEHLVLCIFHCTVTFFLERNHFKIDKFEIKVPKYCRFHNAMIAIVQNVSNMLRSYGTWVLPGKLDLRLLTRRALSPLCFSLHCDVFCWKKSFDDGNFQNRKIEILNISILGICERQCFSSILENFCEYSNWYNRLYFSPQMLSNYIWVIKKHINTCKNHETLFKLLLNRLQSAMEVLYWVVMHPPLCKLT